jgi:pimeloyl-ACP methyl ester carboxylesterase
MSHDRSQLSTIVTAVLVLSSTGCLSRRFVAESAGDYGWSQVDAHGAPGENVTSVERLEALPLGPSSPGCPELKGRIANESKAPVLIFVHGIGGEGPEWNNAISILMKAGPAAAFMFKWVAYEERDQMVQRLAAGVSRLSQCTHHPILVLAHSAGGVLSSFAASLVAVPDDATVSFVTVASPLAGTMARKAADDGESQLFFLFDLGTRITNYPPSAARVRVWHLRTQFPADHVMEPGPDHLAPNEITVGVPAAFQYTLPAELSHVASLTYVARRIARENWLEWLEIAQASIPPQP